MTLQSQNRLIGAVILIALGVIFIPDFLESSKTSSLEGHVTLPVDAALHNDSEVIDQAILAEEAKTQIEEKRARQEAQKVITPVEKPQFQKQAWVLQVGVFRYPNNANALVNKLRKAGYTTQVTAIETKSGTFSRVYVGPDISREKLLEQKDKITQLVGIEGQIVEFNPLKGD